MLFSYVLSRNIIIRCLTIAANHALRFSAVISVKSKFESCHGVGVAIYWRSFTLKSYDFFSIEFSWEKCMKCIQCTKAITYLSWFSTSSVEFSRSLSGVKNAARCSFLAGEMRRFGFASGQFKKSTRATHEVNANFADPFPRITNLVRRAIVEVDRGL